MLSRKPAATAPPADSSAAATKDPKKEGSPPAEGEVDALSQAFAKVTVDSVLPPSGGSSVLSGMSPANRRVLEFLASALKPSDPNKAPPRVIVMCGAGISVSAGIPDFRSPGTGLYSKLAKYKLPTPEAIFELSYFRNKPDAFYKLCAELWPGNFEPTPCHRFIKLLHDRELLLRCFTQNIDSLEVAAGLPKEALVAAHGNFDSASCANCGKEVPIEDVALAVKGKISWADLNKKHETTRVKPDIVFFGENLPERFGRCSVQDFPKCDLLIVMGTSLQVYPFAGLVRRVGSHVPRVLINREEVGPFRFNQEGGRDYFFKGDCDVAAQGLCELLKWGAL